MSFLTPLYILGLATISLPILFHLIRRTPKGIVPFSSLMFVAPTPPRLTRRSRLDQILLLLLRAAIICLLAFAFARPFLRRGTASDLDDVSDRVYAVLIDTSGSMRRAGIWQQVEAELEDVLDHLGPHDVVSLYQFGNRAERIASLEEAKSLEPGGRADLIRQRFAELKPAWSTTELGDALVLAADDLDAIEETGPKPTRKQLVVISDLQQGSHIEALQAYQWPQDVHVEFRRVTAVQPGNASLQMLGTLAEVEDEDERGVRVRVENSADAVRTQFNVGWADATGRALGPRIGVSVPAGESRVVHVPRLAPEFTPTHIRLDGDTNDFDDRYFVATATPTPGSIVYVGEEAADDPDQMLYYLKRAVTNDEWQPVDVITDREASLTALESDQPLLVVITSQLEPAMSAAVRTYLQQGGHAMLVLSAPSDLQTAEVLIDAQLGTAADAVPDDYVLWSEIDFSHRLFRPFANPLFNDFSKIYFWRYRRLNLSEENPLKTIVRYDNGDAALLECPVGEGMLTILTANWRPDDSQLARSTKFVPLLLRIIGTDSSLRGVGYRVNEPIEVAHLGTTLATVTKPDGTVVPLASDEQHFAGADQPGLYLWRNGDDEQRVAVNIDRSETRTAPLDIAQLEQRGVHTNQGTTFAEEAEALRQARDIELEARQSVWQWLIAAALLLVIIETMLAGRWSMQTVATAT